MGREVVMLEFGDVISGKDNPELFKN